MGTYTDLLQENTKSTQKETQEQAVKRERPSERTAERADDRLNEQTSERPTDRTGEREIKTKRSKVRHSFEFYQDQITALKEMQRTAVLQNEEFSMSAVVREAIDYYLNKRTKQ